MNKITEDKCIKCNKEILYYSDETKESYTGETIRMTEIFRKACDKKNPEKAEAYNKKQYGKYYELFNGDIVIKIHLCAECWLDIIFKTKEEK